MGVEKIGVGIVGAGFGEKVLIPAFRSDARVEIRGVASTRKEKAQFVAKKHGISTGVGSALELVEDPSITALAVAIPPAEQDEIIELALKHGKHVFAEKPLSLSQKKSARWAEIAREANLVGMVDFEFPEVPIFLKAKEIIDRQEIGRCEHGIVNWQIQMPAHRLDSNSWKVGASQGGVLNLFFCHVIYYLEEFFGPISSLQSSVFPEGKDESVHALLRFNSGFCLTASVGTNSNNGSGHRIEVYGTKGMLSIYNPGPDHMAGFRMVHKNEEGGEFVLEPTPLDCDGRIPAVSGVVKRFIDAIINPKLRKQVRPSFEDGARVDNLLASLRKSSDEKSTVNL